MATASVLICEDEALVAKDLERSLQRNGYRVVGTASNAHDALKIAEQHRPDLALLDIHIVGNMNGIELGLMLSKRFDIPSIYLTAYADDETLDQAKVTQPLGYLLKPFQEQELRTTIEVGLYRHRRQRDLLHVVGSEEENEMEERGGLQRVVRYLKQFSLTKRLGGYRELSARIASQLRGELTAIGEDVQFLAAQDDIPWTAGDFLRDISEHQRVASSVLSRLSAFGANEDFALEDCQIDEVIALALMDVPQLTRGDVELMTSLSGEVLMVAVDKEAVKGAIAAVIRNACEAMSGGGTITLRSERSFEELPERFNPNSRPGWYVVVTISDSGLGMTEEEQEKIFEPFFSGEMSRGTGLGLSVAYGIMQSHGGWISIRSKPGFGTHVTLSFPQVSSGMTQSKPNAKPDTVPDQPVVLVIDDEAAIVDFMQKFFTDAGYKTFAFTDPEDALTWYKNHSDEVDLVFLDMKMPERDGKACFDEMRSINRQQSIALMSAYSDEKAVQQLLAEGALEFFEKPFEMKKVLEWTESLLDQRKRH